mgnify:FL=1
MFGSDFLPAIFFVSLFGHILGTDEVLPDSGEGNALSISPTLSGQWQRALPYFNVTRFF